MIIIRRHFSSPLATALLASVVLFPAPAAAQSAATNDPAKLSTADASSDAAAAATKAGTAPQATPAPAETDDRTIGDIVVTAQRREERLQDIPAAISAVGAEQLSSAGITSTRDLQQVTPSIAFTQASYAPQPAIRGIGTRGVNPGDEQVVPIYLDGVYQPFVLGGIFELTDVARIEVLRGPQGTLLGRNATGGAINIITTTPEPGFSGRATVGYGRFNQREADLYLSGGSERATASFNFQYLADDGYVRDIINNRTFGSIESFYGRGKVVLRPDDETTITVAANHSNRYDDTSLANFALNGNTIARRGRPGLIVATGNRQSSQDPGFIPALRVEQNAASVTAVHSFSGFDLTSISGYSFSKLFFDADADMTPAQVIRLSSRQYDRSFTQELFAASTGSGPFQWVAGVFYFNNGAGQNPRNLNGGLIFTLTGADAYAAYAQGTYDLTPRFHVTAGGRYSYDRKRAEARNGTGSQILLPQKRSWDSFNPTVSVDFELNDDARLYARYATAFKSGVFNATGFAATPVDPEQVKSYEAGLKADPLSWLRTNLAVFYTNYDNIQIFSRSADVNNASVILQNAATATIFGIEGDVEARPIRGLTLRANASYLDAKYARFPNASSLRTNPLGGNDAITIDASGNQLSRVPEFTGNVGADYRFDLFGGNATMGANVYHNSGFPWSVDDRVRQASFTLVNAQLSWSAPGDRYTVSIWGRNLTNSDNLLTLSSSVLGDQAAYSRPISYGARLTTRF